MRDERIGKLSLLLRPVRGIYNNGGRARRLTTRIGDDPCYRLCAINWSSALSSRECSAQHAGPAMVTSIGSSLLPGDIAQPP